MVALVTQRVYQIDRSGKYKQNNVDFLGVRDVHIKLS